MKRLFLFAAVFSMLFAVSSYAINPSKIDKASSQYIKVESNYLRGLSSDNFHLKVSCAYFLGKIQSEKAVLPLMKMFRNSKNENERLIAAWSLLKIDNPRGVFLVKSAIEHGECKNTGCMLSFLYKDYCLNKYGKIDKD